MLQYYMQWAEMPFQLYLDSETRTFKYMLNGHEHPAAQLSG